VDIALAASEALLMVNDGGIIRAVGTTQTVLTRLTDTLRRITQRAMASSVSRATWRNWTTAGSIAASENSAAFSIQKSRARPASPRSRPTSPVNGAGGITGCRDDSQAPGLVPASVKFFRTRLSDDRQPDRNGFVRVVFVIAMGRGTSQHVRVFQVTDFEGNFWHTGHLRGVWRRATCVRP
jgi:hypothetical protein